MNDLIDRQAAIDAVIKRDANCGIDSAEVLKALPSAQPEKRTEKRTETHACDLIDRQAAIEAINSMFAPTPTQMDMKEDCLEMIENLPSAQPETKKATWALHTYMPHHYYCTNCKKDSPYNKVWDHCPHCGFKMEDYV